MDPYDDAPLPDRPDRPLPPNLETARQYLTAIENGDTGDALGHFFAPEVEHREYPNRLNPKGSVSGLGAILDAAESGRRTLSNQRFEVRHAVVDGDKVAMELHWTGTLNQPLGTLSIGGEMRAHFAVFLEFRNGKVVRQANYDCFEEF